MQLITPSALKKPAADSFEQRCRFWDTNPGVRQRHDNNFEKFLASSQETTKLKKPAADSFEQRCRRFWDTNPGVRQRHDNNFEKFLARFQETTKR